MSQQAQAEGLHQEGIQRFEEARTALEKLHTQNKAGELSDEALTAEETRIHGLMKDGEALRARAADLNTIDRGVAELNELARTPRYVRPMDDGASSEGAEAEPGEALAPQIRPIDLGAHVARMGMSETQLSNACRLAGVGPTQFRYLAGRERTLMNRYLGGKKRGQQLTAEELSSMTHPARRPEQLNINPYIDPDGGAIVAQEIRNEIIGHIRDERHIRGRARVIPTTAASVAFPNFKMKVSLKQTKAHKGKVDASAPRSIRDIIGKTEFVPAGKGEMIQIPEQLVEDMTMDLVGFITEEIALQAFDDEEGQFLTGSGVNEPFGVLPALTLGGIGTPHTGASAALFKPEDLKTLPFKIRAAFRSSGVWMAFRSFYEDVTVMRSDSGAGAGTGNFLFQPGLRAGDPPTLIGFAALESEFFPDHIDGTGGVSQTAGDPMVLFGDWRQYWIVERLGLEIRVLDQLYAETEQIGYRFRKRLDAAPVRLESWTTLDRI
jgi:HK97 family phage major capsid protein